MGHDDATLLPRWWYRRWAALRASCKVQPSRRRPLRRPGSRSLLLFVVVFTACTEPHFRSQVVITVATDLGVPQSLDSVEFSVEVLDRLAGGSAGLPRFQHTVDVRDLHSNQPLALVLESPGSELPTVRVIVTGYSLGSPLVEQQAVVRFRSNESLSLPMTLLRICQSTLCEVGATTCGTSGRCEPIERVDLQAWSGPIPENLVGPGVVVVNSPP